MKTFKKYLALTMSVIILSLSFATYISAADINFIKVDNVSDIKKCVKTETVGLNKVKTLSEDSLEKIKRIDASNSEKFKKSLEAVGIAYCEDSEIQQDLSENFDRIRQINVKSGYLKVAADGTQIPLDEKTCLEEVEKTESVSAGPAKASAPVYGGNEGKDTSYMRWAILYTYDGSARYSLAGEFEWLKMPLNRFTDAFSLSSSMFSFNNAGTNSYERILRYTRLWTGDINKTESKSLSSKSDPKISEVGAFYTWNLPNDSHSLAQNIIYTKLMAQIWTKATVTYPKVKDQNLKLYSTYSHKILNIKGSFSIPSAQTGVSFSGATSISTKTYNGYYTWSYANDRNLMGEK